MNNNLVPELRTDKNGVTSKRWVKPAATGSAGKQWAPRPTLQDKKAREETISKLADEMHDLINGTDELEYESLKDLRANMSKYRDETIGRLKEFFEDKSLGFRYHSGPHHTLAGMIEDGADDTLVNDLLTYLPTGMMKESVIAFSYYRQQHGIEWDQSSEYDPKMIALAKTARAVSLYGGPKVSAFQILSADNRWGVSVIEDPRLVKLVLERLEDNERINDIIKGRRGAGYDVIVAALDDPVQALTNGIL